jgi:hypothetical protein
MDIFILLAVTFVSLLEQEVTYLECMAFDPRSSIAENEVQQRELCLNTLPVGYDYLSSWQPINRR